MSDHDRKLVRENPEAVAELPESDPLRKILAEEIERGNIQVHVSTDDAEARAWTASLRDVPLPNFESDLHDIASAPPVATTRRRWFVYAGAIAAAVLVALIRTVPTASAEATVIAVKVWQEECGSCQRLDTAFEPLRSEFSGEDCRFVTLDLTTEASRRAAEATVRELGLTEVLPDLWQGTGVVILVDPKARRVVGRLTSGQTREQMRQQLVALVDRPR